MNTKIKRRLARGGSVQDEAAGSRPSRVEEVLYPVAAIPEDLSASEAPVFPSLPPDRLELLDSWKSGHTGFSAHNRVTVAPGDGEGLERLARYLLRAPLSLERLELDGSVAHYRHERATKRRGEAFDAHDFLARLLQHIPAPRLHLVRYYGHYANAARAKRRKGMGRPSSRPPPGSRLQPRGGACGEDGRG